ncbi:hypothetical protein [Algicella marina]|uniref:DUF2497 domain-containing protein n=1 Tax=Algicella marina TaxID=2683284 RepID=A0A6P1T1F2_9RHOB|nr:hypothetical protein [Algicella marina]QHQ35571.1 hypothetical protein GO499_10450 [Algicella marina]
MSDDSLDSNDDRVDVLSSIRRLVAEEAESQVIKLSPSDITSGADDGDADQPFILGDALRVDADAPAEQGDDAAEAETTAEILQLDTPLNDNTDAAPQTQAEPDAEDRGPVRIDGIPSTVITQGPSEPAPKPEEQVSADEEPLVLHEPEPVEPEPAHSEESETTQAAVADTDTTGGNAGMDEEQLRTMVAEVVRAELQGELGERLTGNIRKMVRREVLHILDLTGADGENLIR